MMSSFLDVLDSLYPQAASGIAKITLKRSDNSLEAVSPSGVNLILYGAAEIGDSVFYRLDNHQITAPAPNLTWTEEGV